MRGGPVAALDGDLAGVWLWMGTVPARESAPAGVRHGRLAGFRTAGLMLDASRRIARQWPIGSPTFGGSAGRRVGWRAVRRLAAC